MTTSMLACGKANAYGSLKTAARKYTHYYSTTTPPVSNGKHAARNEDPESQRELFVNILNSNATRRDAKQYLSRFKPPAKSNSGPKPDLYALLDERNARLREDQERLDRVGVNLGSLYAPARAIADTPRFFHHEEIREQSKQTSDEEIHVALACLRTPEKIDDTTLDGLARTLAQLVRLDMRILLVLDSNGHDVSTPDGLRELRKSQAQQADRICDAIDRHNAEGARSVPNALEVSDQDGEVHVTLPNLLIDPLKRGMVPIIASLAYTTSGQIIPVSVSNIMTGLTKHLFGSGGAPAGNVTVLLDRVILLDAIGGIPSKSRGDGAHVFINLEQEFNGIAEELTEYATHASDNGGTPAPSSVYHQHRSNMDLARQCLEILPSTASAVIVSPEEAASSSREQAPTLGTGTRRQKNPLIHNLLTNKPSISSSLPAARFAGPDGQMTGQTTTTVLRRGMPLKLIPFAPHAGWEPPSNGTTSLDLKNDPRVDLPRLVHLIQDSFRRKLNVEHYLARIQDRIAGIIVAGEYEGGAILTWEMPPGVNDPVRLVPYLDKFAVLQTSQGSSGVADIVFQAMVRSCFPNGVCWRSRQDNPVNKWYFERSAGTWQIPDSNWTMFWTGEGIVENPRKWNDYVGVCSSIAANWLDDKRPD